MTEQYIRDMIELEKEAERTGEPIGSLPYELHYDCRGILAYCREKGIEPIDMTVRERQQFIKVSYRSQKGGEAND